MARKRRDELLDGTQSFITNLVDQFIDKNSDARRRQIHYWKLAEYYWQGIHNVYFDTNGNDWVVAGSEDNDINLDLDTFENQVNILEQHGESTIAAIANAVPKVKFFPNDAENVDDIAAAEEYSKLSDIIQKDNKHKMMFLKCLFIVYNYGPLFAYNHMEEDGDTQVEMKQEEYEAFKVDGFCEECSSQVYGTINDTMPDELPDENYCPTCEKDTATSYSQDKVMNLRETEEEVKKSTMEIKVEGPLHVDIPMWARRVRDLPYLCYEEELHISQIREMYKDEDFDYSATEDSTTYSRLARMPQDYFGGRQYHESSELVTLRKVWLRPWALFYTNKIEDKDVKKQLKEFFRKGICCVFCNDELVEAYEEVLDNRWSIAQSPLSTHIHAWPRGRQVIPIQNTVNNIVNIISQTILHGIPQNFADPSVLDFDSYSLNPPRPGDITKAKAKDGTLASGFHQLRTAVITGGTENFQGYLDKKGQEISGDLPSIHGGANPGGSRTYSEYQLSNSQAMQRLKIVYEILQVFWADMLGKATRAYAQYLEENSKDVSTVDEIGNTFKNKSVKSESLIGNVGDVIPEVSEGFPVGPVEKRDTLLRLIELNNPIFNAALQHPESVATVISSMGMTGLNFPGSEARNKQLNEINQLINEESTMVMDEELGQETPVSSISVSVTDYHVIEAETIKSYLTSPEGIKLKEENQTGYQNVIIHFLEHVQEIAKLQMQQQPQQEQQQNAG